MRGTKGGIAVVVSIVLASMACSSSESDSAGGTGCKTDNECKGDRVCTLGQCVDRAGAGGTGTGGAGGAAGSAGSVAGAAGASGAGAGGGGGYVCASSASQIDCGKVAANATTLCTGNTFCASAIGGCPATSIGDGCKSASSPSAFAALGCLGQVTTCEGYAACKAQCAFYFQDACSQCVRPACSAQLAACGKDNACFTALGCVQGSTASGLNCQVSSCTGAIASSPAANDVLVCLADKCGAVCGATAGFPCQTGAGTGAYLGASCGGCVDGGCASLASACMADAACKSALSCVKSGLGAGKTMNCAVDGCINAIASSPKANDVLVCMADKCGSTCKATSGFTCP